MDIHTSSDTISATTHAAAAIEDLLLAHSDVPILFLLSGGSPLEIIKHLSSKQFDSRVTIGVTDERFSADPTINNFAQVMAMPWYTEVINNGVHTIDTRPLPGETLEGMGERFDSILKQWKTDHPNGKIIITQGIGMDAHTAGIMPYPDDAAGYVRRFDDPAVWAVGYDAGKRNKYPLRVTTTLPFLRLVDHTILFVCGKEKEQPFKKALASKEDLAAVPGRIIHQMKHCLLFTDLTI
jgi:6-phosphogluconolactonase/glucosamine-6-phosphate isomerase/deaminase